MIWKNELKRLGHNLLYDTFRRGPNSQTRLLSLAVYLFLLKILYCVFVFASLA